MLFLFFLRKARLFKGVGLYLQFAGRNILLFKSVERDWKII
jgi:hypothetical protein